MMCRVHLCRRKAIPDSNLCDGHYRQLVARALAPRKPEPEITESEKRALWGDR